MYYILPAPCPRISSWKRFFYLLQCTRRGSTRLAANVPNRFTASSATVWPCVPGKPRFLAYPGIEQQLQGPSFRSASVGLLIHARVASRKREVVQRGTQGGRHVQLTTHVISCKIDIWSTGGTGVGLSLTSVVLGAEIHAGLLEVGSRHPEGKFWICSPCNHYLCGRRGQSLSHIEAGRRSGVRGQAMEHGGDWERLGVYYIRDLTEPRMTVLVSLRGNRPKCW